MLTILGSHLRGLAAEAEQVLRTGKHLRSTPLDQRPMGGAPYWPNR